MDGSSVISADRHNYWHVDHQDGSFRVVRQDGQIFDEDLEVMYRRPDSQVATSTFDREKWWSAAGYADYVCAETHTGTQLRAAQRMLGRSETVFTTLNELVVAVRGDDG